MPVLWATGLQPKWLNDEAISNNVDSELIVSGIVAFFKKLSWINFSHGDAKSSNFFIFKKSIIALDLDTAGKQGFISIKKKQFFGTF